MKKHILLSVAAATALTFGATNDAKAETMQPASLKVQNFSNSLFSIQHMNQGNLHSFLSNTFSYVKWAPISMEQNNCIIPGQVVYPIPCEHGFVTNPCDQAEAVTPEEKPETGNETVAPEEKPETGNETVAPEEKPETGNETVAPEEKPETGNETVAPEEKPETGNETVAPEEKPETGNETTKPEENGTTNNNETTKPEENKPTEEVDSSLSAFEQKVVDLTNAERAKQGLPALKVDTLLSKVARVKSEDMQKNRYFDHTSPTYGSPFDMMKQFGVSYKSAGENIAQGQRTPEEVVQAWMNSSGHRANILNNGYTHIGVGYVENGNYWTQQFITK
ncbi:CAP domain-containing protein [Bacillus manliponensis]